MKNSSKFGEINYLKNERGYKPELDRIEFAGEKVDSETIEQTYGQGVDSAAYDKRNDAVLQEIAFTIRYFKELEQDAQSPDPETRQRAKIKLEIFNQKCHAEKVNGVWKMIPGSRINGGW